MKTQIFILIVVVSIVVGNVQGLLIWDSGDHVFSEGTEDFIEMYNDATATITGGEIWEFYMYDNTAAAFSGGRVIQILCHNNATVSIEEGFSSDLLKPFDSAIATIQGGEINSISTWGSSITTIYQASINFLDSEESSIVVMYVEDYNWDPTGGQWGDGLLTGSWLQNSQPFSIQVIDVTTINHINFIPEPTTLALLAFGGLFVSRIC